MESRSKDNQLGSLVEKLRHVEIKPLSEAEEKPISPNTNDVITDKKEKDDKAAADAQKAQEQTPELPKEEKPKKDMCPACREGEMVDGKCVLCGSTTKPGDAAPAEKPKNEAVDEEKKDVRVSKLIDDILLISKALGDKGTNGKLISQMNLSANHLYDLEGKERAREAIAVIARMDDLKKGMTPEQLASLQDAINGVYTGARNIQKANETLAGDEIRFTAVQGKEDNIKAAIDKVAEFLKSKGVTVKGVSTDSITIDVATAQDADFAKSDYRKEIQNVINDLGVLVGEIKEITTSATAPQYTLLATVTNPDVARKLAQELKGEVKPNAKDPKVFDVLIMKESCGKVHEGDDEAKTFEVTDVLADDLAKKLEIDLEKIDRGQFKKGLEVEQEHADITKGDPEMTAKIVLAHLGEIPDYYSRLAKMEDDAKKPAEEQPAGEQGGEGGEEPAGEGEPPAEGSPEEFGELEAEYAEECLKEHKVMAEDVTALRKAVAEHADLFKDKPVSCELTNEGWKINVNEVAPPGWEKTVKQMKKHKDISNPWALAWHMKGKGYKPAKESLEEGKRALKDGDQVDFDNVSAVYDAKKNEFKDFTIGGGSSMYHNGEEVMMSGGRYYIEEGKKREECKGISEAKGAEWKTDIRAVRG